MTIPTSLAAALSLYGLLLVGGIASRIPEPERAGPSREAARSVERAILPQLAARLNADQTRRIYELRAACSHGAPGPIDPETGE